VTHQQQKPRLIPLSLVTFVAGCWMNSATANEPIRWKNAAAIAQRLEMPLGTGIHWSRRAIRDALHSLSRQGGVQVAIFLDRRVDPGRPLDLQIADGTLREALDRIADYADLGWCQVGPVIYFGPTATARRLRTLVEMRKDELTGMPAAAASKLRRIKAWRWDDLATPRELVEEWAHEADFKLDGLERIPHDLWAAADLPPATAIERLSLVLAGYDLTFAVDAARNNGASATLRLVTMPATAVLTRSYAIAAANDALVASLKKKCPDAELRQEGGKLIVVGRAEDHAAIDDAIKGKTAKTATKKALPKLSNVRTTLTAKNQPVGQLLRDTARQPELSLDLVIDDEAIAAAGLSLDKLVTVELKLASVAEVLTAITKPAGLTFELRGRTVRIKPATKTTKPKT
jgi:hypothetical protein